MSALPVKADIFITTDISFAPTLRVIVPKGESEDYILSVAKKKLEKLGSRELVKWILPILTPSLIPKNHIAKRIANYQCVISKLNHNQSKSAAQAALFVLYPYINLN